MLWNVKNVRKKLVHAFNPNTFLCKVRGRFISSFCQIGYALIQARKLYDSLCQCTQARPETNTFTFVRHQSCCVVMSFQLSFIFILRFHHSLTFHALSSLSPSLAALLFFIIFLFCFSFKLPLSLSHQAPSLPLTPPSG